MTKEERKKRVQEAWKKLKTTSRDSKEFKEVLTTWNKLDTEYLKTACRILVTLVMS